ncbi:MAG: DUF2235 domain-containing protein [Pseudomonadota bacterium]
MPKKAPKKLVVLCDGTSNEIEAERTNVLRLFQCVETMSSEVIFYDPGVGTVGAYSNWNRWWIWTKEIMGLAFGKGLDDNVLSAYQFLIDNWEPGDKIYLFGFSRGSYTVRVLAGMIYTMGIFSPAQSNLKRYALDTIKQASLKGDFQKLGIYQKTLDRKPVEIEFLGLWDTVSSVFLWVNGVFRIVNIGFTARNSAIKTVRQALSIDERRRFFVQYNWVRGQKHTTDLPNTKAFKEGEFPPQDLKEVWFAGTHCDVGGGFIDAKSQVPKIAMEWLVREAQQSGLHFNEDKLDYFLGRVPDENGHSLTKQDATAPLYKSLAGAWWIVEFLPKWRNFSWSNPLSWFNFYLPLGRRRTMYDAEMDYKIQVHETVKTRQDKTGYNPSNLPPSEKIEWVTTTVPEKDT